jgi:NitT/TauT family transport system ATP-binding protein
MKDGAPARLRVKDAVVSFGAFHVLGPLSFEVKAGQCVVLLGPSGCGKSTLLAAAAGLQSLMSGSIWTGDGNTPPGFVFQDPNLLGWASAIDNVALPLALSRTPRGDQKVRARAALDLVGLGDFETARPKELSGGMAMRVALARALVGDPEVLLLDEPFGAIDEIGRRGLNDLVHVVKNRRGMGILFVTHSVEEAVYMADTILVMSARPGQIVATIEVSQSARDTDFLVSDRFGDTVTQARRALARGLSHESF